MPVHGGPSEKYETIGWNPQLQDTGNLLAAATITATAEASGLGSADASIAKTIQIPTDSRLAITRLALRLLLTNTLPANDTNLFVRVYVDAQNAANLILDLNYTTGAAQISVAEVTAALKPVAFALMTDGAAHTYYFFCWRTGTGTGPVISLCQMYLGVGTASDADCVKLTFTGEVGWGGYAGRSGTGTFIARIQQVGATYSAFNGVWEAATSAGPFFYAQPGTRLLCPGALWLLMRNRTVATDITYVAALTLTLRTLV